SHSKKSFTSEKLLAGRFTLLGNPLVSARPGIPCRRKAGPPAEKSKMWHPGLEKRCKTLQERARNQASGASLQNIANVTKALSDYRTLRLRSFDLSLQGFQLRFKLSALIIIQRKLANLLANFRHE